MNNLGVPVAAVKRIVYIDMDGVLCNFCKATGLQIGEWVEVVPEMLKKGFFRNLEPIEGAIDAIHEISEMSYIDLRIATKITSKNLNCATEKLEWINIYFPFLVEKTTLTFDKTQLIGDYLLDDMTHLWKGFNGILWHFDQHNPMRSWKDFIIHLKLQQALQQEVIKIGN